MKKLISVTLGVLFLASTSIAFAQQQDGSIPPGQQSDIDSAGDVYSGPSTSEKVGLGADGAVVAGGVSAHLMANHKSNQIWAQKLPNETKALNSEEQAEKAESSAYNAERDRLNDLNTEYKDARDGYYTTETRMVPGFGMNSQGKMESMLVSQSYQQHHDPDKARELELQPQLAPEEAKYNAELKKYNAEEAKFASVQEVYAKAKLAMLSGDSAEATALKAELRNLQIIKYGGDAAAVAAVADLLYKGYRALNDENIGVFAGQGGSVNTQQMKNDYFPGSSGEGQGPQTSAGKLN